MLEEIIVIIVLLFELIGASIIIFGAIAAIIKVFRVELRKSNALSYNIIRWDFTHKIVFGLDFMIAGDIIKSIITPDLDEMILLGVIVGIRTILGYFLTRETQELKADI